MKRLGKFIYFFLFIFYFASFYCVQHASVVGLIYPFAIGLMFAFVWAEQKVWLVCPAYILAAISVNASFENIISSIVACLLIIVPYYVHFALKKRIFKWEMGVFCTLAQAAQIVFQILSGSYLVVVISGVIACVAFMYVCIQIFEPVLVRGFAYKLTTFELICGAVLLCAISDGLAGCNIYGFSILKLFVAFLLLSISHTTKATVSCLVAGILGLGTLIGSNNAVYIAPFIVWALAISAFKSRQRIFSFFSIILSDLLLGYAFGVYFNYGLIDVLPVIIGACIFLFLPSGFYNNVAKLLSYNDDRLAGKNLLNRSREVLFRHISNLSEVFCEMDGVFKKLIKKQMSPEEIKNMLYEEVKNDICQDCPERSHCHRTFASDTKEVFQELFAIAMQRGKVTFLDIPSYLSSRCNRVNSLINDINTLTSQYKNYSNLVANVDTSKLLVADQLCGVSHILKDLANEVQATISFDTVREHRIIEELAVNNILCTDAVVYEKDRYTYLASLIVRNEDSDRLKIPEIVGKICGCKMCVIESYPSQRAGLVTINLATAPHFDCLFGLSSCCKSGASVSGDCHSVVRLDGDRFLFAICDGMGSGEKAEQKSETTISLIENFYKAGFENDIILSSVNKLLNLESDDVFSTIDVCVVDLKNGVADFVKMGSPSSLIRKIDSCQEIVGQALPVGVLQEAKAYTQKVVLTEKDMIVICSDGISDSFASNSEFKDFVLSIVASNPQEFADKILEKALAANNGYAVDDMTCLVVKIFKT